MEKLKKSFRAVAEPVGKTASILKCLDTHRKQTSKNPKETVREGGKFPLSLL